MNIMINEEEANRLFLHEEKRFLMGSHLYGTNTENSDKDYIVIYDDVIFKDSPLMGLPNIHQFQYKDVENNIDYIFTSWRQFWQNQQSGDSTINSDIILLGKSSKWSEEKRLKYCTTYKVIKAYLGFAKRDLKDWKKEGKVFHAARSIYTAQALLKNKIPSITMIQEMKRKCNIISIPEYKNDLHIYRTQLNDMYQTRHLENYYIPTYSDSLVNKLAESNNTRQFKY